MLRFAEEGLPGETVYVMKQGETSVGAAGEVTFSGILHFFKCSSKDPNTLLFHRCTLTAVPKRLITSLLSHARTRWFDCTMMYWLMTRWRPGHGGDPLRYCHAVRVQGGEEAEAGGSHGYGLTSDGAILQRASIAVSHQTGRASLKKCEAISSIADASCEEYGPYLRKRCCMLVFFWAAVHERERAMQRAARVGARRRWRVLRMFVCFGMRMLRLFHRLDGTVGALDATRVAIAAVVAAAQKP